MKRKTRKTHRVVRYTDHDVIGLLTNRVNRPAWERTAHLKAAAKQRGFRGSELAAAIRFLEREGKLYK